LLEVLTGCKVEPALRHAEPKAVQQNHHSRKSHLEIATPEDAAEGQRLDASPPRLA
jgi:hypothetical protein